MTLSSPWGVLWVLLLIATAPLAGMSLTEAEKSLKSGKKSEIFRAYDTFKSAYMQAAGEADNRAKLRALNGIVSSGEILHIDVEPYRQKRKRLQKKPKQKPRLQKVSNTVKEKHVPKVAGQNRLRDVRWESGKLVFEFDQELRDKDINYFKLKKTTAKGHRYVFDIHAVLNRSHTLKHEDLKRIRLSQYRPTTLRLVLESVRKRHVRFSVKGRQLVINAQLGKVTSPKVHPVHTAGISRKQKVIVIDPGHGGKDPGAIGYRKTKEKAVVFAIAKKMAAQLRSRGYTVYMTRTNDHFVKLRNRTHYANKKKADLFISIHANAVAKRYAKKTHGIETYFLSPSRSKRATNAAAMENRAEVEDMNFYGKSTFLNALNSEKIVASHKLAIDLQASVLSSLRAHYNQVKDAGVREGPFWVLVGAQMPAVLVEVGFLTHSKEGARLQSTRYQDYFARGLADGVERYFVKNR